MKVYVLNKIEADNYHLYAADVVAIFDTREEAQKYYDRFTERNKEEQVEYYI